MAPQWLEVGRIGSPYGVRGWMHVESFTDPAARLLDYREWHLRSRTGEPIARRLAEGREHGGGLVARLDDVEDRDAAALLQGMSIEVARSALPQLKAREFYQADLIGLAVANLEGIELGAVRHFVETLAGPVMVVQQAAREHWVPATKPYLNKVDLASGRILVDWPAELE